MIALSVPRRPTAGRKALPSAGPAVLLAMIAGLVLATGAHAQILLPGAAPTGPTEPAAPAAPPPKRKAPPPKTIADQAIDGTTLYLNGTRGRLAIEKRDKQALTVRLIAVGEKISQPAESCGVDLGAGQSVPLSAAGRPAGVTRYELGMPGCPVAFDILDGGIYVPPGSQACEFTETDCRVDLHGMWGPPASAIEAEVASIERDRGRADKAVRESYKALLSKVPKTDKPGIRRIAAEQAGFTSERETVCRDYAREAAHGFCATRFTEYRAASLAARLGQAAPAEADARPKPKPKPKPKPAAPAQAIDPLTGLPM